MPDGVIYMLGENYHSAEWLKREWFDSFGRSPFYDCDFFGGELVEVVTRLSIWGSRSWTSVVGSDCLEMATLLIDSPKNSVETVPAGATYLARLSIMLAEIMRIGPRTCWRRTPYNTNHEAKC